jgi:hypothetical protein
MPLSQTIEGVSVVNDLITAALLFAQFSITRRWAHLVLASGYLFTALIIVPHALSFPGAFAPTGLLGGGLQSTSSFYNFWKAGLPIAVILYVPLKDADGGTSMSERSPSAVIPWSITIVIAIVCGLIWIATVGEKSLPRLMLDGTHADQRALMVVAIVLVSLGTAALVLLWIRRSSVLDLWLMVMCCTLILEVAMANFLISSRFSVGWYASRVYSLTSSLVILLVLLSEMTTIYAHLARSVMRQRGAGQVRQIAMDAMAASIAHEVNQPLGAMVANANAGLRWLTNTTPDLDRARAAFEGGTTAGELPSLLCGRSYDRCPTPDRDSPGRTNGNAVSNPRIRA